MDNRDPAPASSAAPAFETMREARAAFLDVATLGQDIDLTPLLGACDTFTGFSRTTPAQIALHAAQANVVICNKTVLDDSAIAALPALELILVTATGVDNVDLGAAALRGIAVCNCRDYGTAAVAQHTLALMLALHARLGDYAQRVRAGEWSQAEDFSLIDPPILEMQGRTLGIFGRGAIGSEVARLAAAFGMNVLFAQLPGRPARPDTLPWRELLARADVVSLHCPLTDHTRGLIDAEALALMKPGALLLNTARGALVDEAALAQALREGRVAGAGVDVLAQEPPRDGSPLLAADLPNLIVTPHHAWASRQARQRLVQQSAENLLAWRRGAPLRNVLSGQ